MRLFALNMNRNNNYKLTIHDYNLDGNEKCADLKKIVKPGGIIFFTIPYAYIDGHENICKSRKIEKVTINK